MKNGDRARNGLAPRFLQQKGLSGFSPAEWEALCDGCGKCCLIKLEDEDDEAVYYTAAVCRFYDEEHCGCSVYSRRTERVKTCIKLTHGDLDSISWLPSSCSYRLLYEGKPLPPWHHLVCNDRKRVHQEGHSIIGRCVSEDNVHSEQLPDMVVRWV